MHAAQPTRRFDAQLQVQVPRNTPGTLEDGVREVLERIDAVERVDTVDLQGLEPRLNDLTVYTEVEGGLDLDCLDLAPDADSIAGEAGTTRPAVAVADQLEDGFGVAAVADLHLRSTAADSSSAAIEYG